MLYKVINYELHPKDHYVVKFGDFGTKFYILIKGSVGVRIPSLVEKSFTLRELLQYLVENREWIIINDRLQQLLIIIEDFFPELVKSDYHGELSLNYDLATRVLNGEIILASQANCKNFFPQFNDMRKYKGSKENTRDFKFNMMIQVDTFKPGKSFGELALLNNTKRSATIVALEDSHFGVVEKEHFDSVVGKILQKKFAKKVEFLSAFPFLKNVTRIKKEKL